MLKFKILKEPLQANMFVMAGKPGQKPDYLPKQNRMWDFKRKQITVYMNARKTPFFKMARHISTSATWCTQAYTIQVLRGSKKRKKISYFRGACAFVLQIWYNVQYTVIEWHFSVFFFFSKASYKYFWHSNVIVGHWCDG